MPSLYRKTSPQGKTLPNWYCFFRVTASDGSSKQVHRSTGHTTKKEAAEVARGFEKASRAESGADDETAAAILAKISEAGEMALKGRLNPAHGRRLIGEIMMLSGDSTGGNFTLREWVADWNKEKKESTKPNTALFYRSTTAQFLLFLREKADAPLDAITTKQVRDYRDSIRAAGRTARTANHKLKALRSLFGDAVKVAALLHNPAAPIKSLEETDSTPREPFTSAEVGKLADAAPSADWRGVILLGALTGLRLTDITRLTAGNLDLDRGAIKLTPRKTERKGTTVEIPLHPDLLEFFESHEIPPFAKSSLFPTLANVEAGHRSGLSNQFREIMEAARVDRGVARTKETGAARETAARSFHSLRHTFTSWLAKADVPEEVRMKMTGHTESKTHQKYTHQELSTLRDGVDKIPRLNQVKKS
jgi:integrase